MLPMGFLMGKGQKDQPAGGVMVDGVVIHSKVNNGKVNNGKVNNGKVMQGKVNNGLMMVEGVIKDIMIKDIIVVLVTGTGLTRRERMIGNMIDGIMIVVINGAIKAWSMAPPPLGGQTPTSWRHHPMAVMGGPRSRNSCQHMGCQ